MAPRQAVYLENLLGTAEQTVKDQEYEIKFYKRRAFRAEAGLKLGPCKTCSLWRRDSTSSSWGWCTLTEKIRGTDWPWRGEPQQKIATKENFGCIRFEAKTPEVET